MIHILISINVNDNDEGSIMNFNLLNKKLLSTIQNYDIFTTFVICKKIINDVVKHFVNFNYGDGLPSIIRAISLLAAFCSRSNTGLNVSSGIFSKYTAGSQFFAPPSPQGAGCHLPQFSAICSMYKRVLKVL